MTFVRIMPDALIRKPYRKGLAIFQVESFDEMVNILMALDTSSLPAGRAVAIITPEARLPAPVYSP